MAEVFSLSFRATVWYESEEWVAHCLDLDIIETGPTPTEAMGRLAEGIGVQYWYARTHDNLAYLFRPAPPEAWERFGKILGRPHRTIVLPIRNSDGDVRLEAQLVAA